MSKSDDKAMAFTQLAAGNQKGPMMYLSNPGQPAVTQLSHHQKSPMMYMSNPENQPLTHKSSINSYAQNVHDVHLVSHEMDLGESMLDSDPDSIDDDIFRDEDVFSSDSEEDGLFSREKHSYSVLEQRSKVGSTLRTNR